MATNFDEPQSRNEAILQNILGADNELLPPFSRIEVLLLELLQQTGMTNEEIAKKLAAPLDGSGNVDEGTDGQILQTNGDGTTSWVDASHENYGAPLVAETVAEMTDHDRIYVYTGNETGYTSGHWYYWNGTAWTDGGVYNAVAVQTDTTLTESGVAADAKATGDAIESLNEDINALGLSVVSGELNITYTTA